MPGSRDQAQNIFLERQMGARGFQSYFEPSKSDVAMSGHQGAGGSGGRCLEAHLTGPFLHGIDGLVIDGATYNVSFAQGTYGAVYSSNAPTFYGNSSGATDAVNALAAALASVDPPFLI